MQQIEEEWFNAARAGDDKRVAKLLAEQPDLIEAKDDNQNTALHHAAEAGHEAVVARLLAAQPTLLLAKNSIDWTALDLASLRNKQKVVAQILATDVVGIDISFCVIHTLVSGSGAVADLLLAAKNPNYILSEDGAESALNSVIEAGDQRSFTQLTVHPSLIESAKTFTLALHQAAEYGRDNMVSQLWAMRPDMIDVVDSYGRNALAHAAENGRQSTAETLLAIKPELILHVSHEGDTVLHYAVVGCKDAEFVAKLWRLNPQALTHANEYFCKTPFHLAVESSKDEFNCFSGVYHSMTL